MKMNKKGFTLLELLVVVAIAGILASLAVTAYVGVTKKASRSEAYAGLDSIYLLQEQFFADNGIYSDNTDYEATHGIDDKGIEDDLRDFKPGGCAPDVSIDPCSSPYGLNYTYSIDIGVALNNPPTPWDDASVVQLPCFIASATGVDGTRTEGDIFAIDCNNIRNF